MGGSVLSRAFTEAMAKVDRSIGWHRLPTPLGILTLVGIRNRLRARNLYDTGERPDLATQSNGERYRAMRTLDGTHNDPEHPLMGSAGARFGRNVPLEHTYPEPPSLALEPNPRVVSRELMTRDEFKPATTLNLLAAAWIQFEVHDWIFHGSERDAPWELVLSPDDPWYERPMRIERTRHDPSWDSHTPRTYVNADTHWWDGSQIYGNDEGFASRLRTGERGKIHIDELGLLPQEIDETQDLSGQAGAFWVGLALLHSLFMREHNAICDHLHSRYRDLSDKDLFQKARLVNAALMAKIHTTEWTPAIIAHPVTKRALKINWWGIAGERFDKRFGRRTKNELLRGIPGSPTNHFGVPYSLTEEFVAVYRMHPLIRDEYTLRSLRDDRVLQERTFRELGLFAVRDRLSELSMDDVFYSFGRMHPGAITLHNYPRFLQEFQRYDGTVVDMAALDVLRIRERGVPRYNEFRRLFHLRPAQSFDDLTDNSEWAEEIRRVYGDDIERVDLMTGMFAEPLPKGFGFSDTAFRVFILMASRRIESDRFFTVDYRPEIYTQAGLDWVEANSMRTLLLRHFPQLEPALRGVSNVFQPWRSVIA
jgi:hypothetical protein